MEKAKLVYTSDKNSQEFLNNKIPGIVKRNEVVESIHSDLTSHHKNIKKIIKEKYSMSKNETRIIKEDWRSLWSIIIDFLQTGSKTHSEIVEETKKRWNRNKENFSVFIRNQLQAAKFSSHFIIYSNENKWYLQKFNVENGMSKEKLLEFMWNNKGAGFNKEEREKILEKYGPKREPKTTRRKEKSRSEKVSIPSTKSFNELDLEIGELKVHFSKKSGQLSIDYGELHLTYGQ